MTTGFLTMSKRELDRAEWMREIGARRATQAQVAERLGLTVRHVERLYRAFKADGAAGLISKKRGRPSGRRLPDTLRVEVLTLVREHYGDFGRTLAHEKLTALHGVKVSVETLRQWMTADGLWAPHASRRRASTRPGVGVPASGSSSRSTAATASGSRRGPRAACCWSTSTTRRAD